MGRVPPKIMVVAPDSLSAFYVAKRCGVMDRNDISWIFDPRMLHISRTGGVQIIEAYAHRPWVKLENDPVWNETYQAIRAEVKKMVSEGKVDVYAKVYCI